MVSSNPNGSADQIRNALYRFDISGVDVSKAISAKFILTPVDAGRWGNMEDLNGGSTTQLIYLNTNDVWLETAATWNTAAPYNTVSIATGTFDPLKEKDIDAEGINHAYDVTNAVKNEPGGMISFRVVFDETVTDSFSLKKYSFVEDVQKTRYQYVYH